MSPTTYAAPVRRLTDACAVLRLVPALVVVAAVVFNAALAAINAHVTPLSQASVIGVEVALVLAAHIVATANYRPQMLTWYALIILLLLFAIWRSLALEQIEARYLRDVLLIPTFIVLGMTFDRRYLVRTVVVVHAIVLVVLVVEAVDSSVYSELFRVQDYYISTRGYDIANFWNKQSDLYVSATRPDTRLFAFIEMHRLSSIFLEPVSLGNYCIIIVAFICSQFSRLDFPTFLFLSLGTLIALIGCDGRLAAVASGLIVASALIARHLPRYSAALYMPAALATGALLVHFAGFEAGSDDFPGRVAHSMGLLSTFGVSELLGIANDSELLSRAVDSGVSYLIITQSAPALAILWMFIVFGSAERTRDQVRFTHATGIYFALTAMVSFAFLTIKTASLLWFIYGTLQATRKQSDPAHRTAPRAPVVYSAPRPRRL